MPRPKKPGAAEPKKRSRNGCWPCKARKVKCGEEKPRCLNCERQGEACDYSIRLNWNGRPKKSADTSGSETPQSGTSSPYTSTFSQSNIFAPPTYTRTHTHTPSPVSGPPPHIFHHARGHSNISAPSPEASLIDPELMRISQTQTQPAMAAYDTLEMPRRGNPTSAPIDNRLQQVQYRGNIDYPSPSASSFDSGSYGGGGYISSGTLDSPASPPAMPPPGRNMFSHDSPAGGARPYAEMLELSGHQAKRQKRSHSGDSPNVVSGPGKQDSRYEKGSGTLSFADAFSPNSGPLTPYSPFTGNPLTPVSSVASEDSGMRNGPGPTTSPYPPPDLRRLSVNSLLTGPPGDNPSGWNTDVHGRHYPVVDSSTTTYGYDVGNPDLDTPKNDDLNAIAVFSPPVGSAGFATDNQSDSQTENGFGDRSKDIAFEKGGYYAKPVPIKISRSLEPLPRLLHDNPMNLLYFHHFLNHTARILVPHDCEQNPFRSILPRMAVQNETVLCLLLAFSASHRARLLNHPEPANRIAVWVQDVFPKLRQDLNSNNEISNPTLTTAIMLASLEIISPNTFEVPISWQNHLTVARQMIIARGGPKSVQRSDQVASFLGRWFAYLDVLGSLSGGKNDLPLDSSYWSDDDYDTDEDYQIDCLLGFTSRCIGILARIAELAKQCEKIRFDEDGNVREGWKPAPDILAKADKIRNDLAEGRDHVYKGCNHRSADNSESEAGWDALEIYATNEAFHWAGLIHLCRRVLGKPATDPVVQNAIREIVGNLYKVRRGSTAEACLLFPMFTAGCDAIDATQRSKIMERLKSVEGFGMTQIHKARELMQKVWDTGKPWETLVYGEFLG
ncbi:uncharacterized protein BDZ99DRAFT_442636 [Mytilinidion resinicola]|uniref:Zn(2)-C6 fungal-type domain-containing protein n=1 Tax=Mytilinidion resinicola TaxID=574789 RepID=A0A6A6YQ24_9PEZI|nr:uncharacterized protein BDZ99DRAFT_442636 [Mytilinidion resinicola]KAF2810124.1 hypothetical protein BDZ99DRAFT_442636 [Mytilinidion resinicola]